MNIILVKNMVCHRCVLSVEEILNKSSIPFYKVLFGEIHFVNELGREQMKSLSTKLISAGFELLIITRVV